MFFRHDFNRENRTLPSGSKKHPSLYATRTKHNAKARANLAMLLSIETFGTKQGDSYTANRLGSFVKQRLVEDRYKSFWS